MEWCDEGIILGSKPCQEQGRIVTVFTAHQGLQRGYMRQVRKNACHTGDRVMARWRARLEDQLGFWTFESTYAPLGFLMALPYRVGLIQIVVALLAQALPVGHPYPALYQHVRKMIEVWTQPLSLGALLQSYLVFEYTFLKQIGYGLEEWSMGEDTPDVWLQRYQKLTRSLEQYVWPHRPGAVAHLRETLLRPLVGHVWSNASANGYDK